MRYKSLAISSLQLLPQAELEQPVRVHEYGFVYRKHLENVAILGFLFSYKQHATNKRVGLIHWAVQDKE